MSAQLLQATKAILAMPYYKNEHARSGTAVHGHEDAVALKLKDAGFTEELKINYPNMSKSLLKNWAKTVNETKLREVAASMPLGSYIVQPAGSQGFPDVLVRDFDDRFIAFECKSSSAGVCPMWNDSLPRPNAIYILNSGKYNTTTVFLGRDVISPEEQALMDEQEKAIEKIVNKYKQKLATLDVHNRGWVQKSRKQHFQYGGNLKVDYFIHSDKMMCEQNVLDFVK